MCFTDKQTSYADFLVEFPDGAPSSLGSDGTIFWSFMEKLVNKSANGVTFDIYKYIITVIEPNMPLNDADHVGFFN